MRALPLALVLLAAVPAASAQVGIGGLIGEPTGLTVKLGGGRGGVAVDVGLDDALFVQAHYIVREQRLRGAGADVRFLFGPGGFFQDTEPDATLGVSALLGAAAILRVKGVR